MPCLWIAIRLKLRGAKGSPRIRSTRAVSRGGRPTFSARTRSPACASPRSEMGSSRRSFFSTGCSQWSSPFRMDDAEHQLAALEQLLHRMSDPAVAALLGAREDAVADAERRRAPAPCAPSPAGAAARPSASQRSGTAQAVPLSSTSTTRSTVTLGTPPILWKARPGRGVDQPLVAHVAGAAASARSCPAPFSPNALAISRLPAGASDDCDEVEDLLRGWGGRRLGRVSLAIYDLNLVIPELEPEPTKPSSGDEGSRHGLPRSSPAMTNTVTARAGAAGAGGGTGPERPARHRGGDRALRPVRRDRRDAEHPVVDADAGQRRRR